MQLDNSAAIHFGKIKLGYDSINRSIFIKHDDGDPVNFYVTGGISMYGQGDTSITTFMDILADNIDPNTLKIENGLLTVLGGTGGGGSGATTLGGLSNVGTWADSVATQDRIMYQPANSSQWVAKNLSDLSVGGVTGDYLPLSGGTLSGSLTIGSSNNTVWTPLYITRNNQTGFVGMSADGLMEFGNGYGFIQVANNVFKFNSDSKTYNVLHSNNYSSYALPLTGGTLTGTLELYSNDSNYGLLRIGKVSQNGYNYSILHQPLTAGVNRYVALELFKHDGTLVGGLGINVDGVAFVSDKTKNTHNIWHNGNFKPSDYLPLSGGMMKGSISFDKGWAYNIGSSSNPASIVYTSSLRAATDGSLSLGASNNTHIHINSSGNVGIGTTNPSKKLHVDGTFRCNSIVTSGDSEVSILNIDRVYASIDYIHMYVTGGTNNSRPLVLQNGYGNVGIKTTTPSYTLDVNGTLNATTIYQNGTTLANTYLSLSGGTLTVDSYENIVIKRNANGAFSGITYSNANEGALGYIGVGGASSSYPYQPMFVARGKESHKIWHSGNDGSGSGLDADTLDGKHDGELTAFYLRETSMYLNLNTITYPLFYDYGQSVFTEARANRPSSFTYGGGLTLHNNSLSGQLVWDINHNSTSSTRNLYWRARNNLGWQNDWKTIAFTDSNVASATKLNDNTSFTAWGQTFFTNGKPTNVSGTVYTMSGHGTHLSVTSETNWNNKQIIYTSWESDIKDYTDILVPSSSSNSARLRIIHNGNIGIGTTSPAYKLDVNGSIRFSSKTLWGQSFDGTGNVSGNMTGVGFVNSTFYVNQGTTSVACLHVLGTTATLDYINLYVSNRDSSRTDRPLVLQYGYGKVGIGVAQPSQKLHVDGNILATGSLGFSDSTNPGSNTSVARIGTFDRTEGGLVIQLGKYGSGSYAWKQNFCIVDNGWTTALFNVDRSGNVSATGGITMYSDQRKKTILNHVELSLKQIANAPLIEHYYNTDESKTTHVGSIAQYWAGMNDWFCKLDNEGYYTMEIQNAALASAISIARELDRYETKTDKTIKQLRKRICQLEEEVERLKSA